MAFFQKIPYVFMRASLWNPCQTNSRLIKVELLWRLSLTYLTSLEVASSNSMTCTKQSAPKRSHCYMYQRLGANGDGSWTVSAILWPEFEAAIQDDPIFHPMFASHL